MQRLLVTGASGFLGWNICHKAVKDWHVFGTVLTHPVQREGITTLPVDLTDFRALKQLFHDVRPDAVIHTAAATSPEYCQNNKAETQKINADAPVHIAGLCADKGIPYVFTSSDLVFDGLHAPYREEDPVSPVNYYGEQKVSAEEGVLNTYPAAAVCRMPLMFGDPGPAASSFYQAMINALRDGKELKLFVDEFRTPVSGKTAARGIFIALEKAHGRIHLGGSERISRYNFGLLLMDTLGIHEAGLIRCRQKDVIVAAARAPDVSLDSAKAFALGFRPPSLREELRDLLGAREGMIRDHVMNEGEG